jgi:DNA-binding IscR family transcriptional regulator
VNCLEDIDCPQFPRCNLRRPVQKIQASIIYLLDTMTLAELTRETVPITDLTTVN